MLMISNVFGDQASPFKIADWRSREISRFVWTYEKVRVQSDTIKRFLHAIVHS